MIARFVFRCTIQAAKLPFSKKSAFGLAAFLALIIAASSSALAACKGRDLRQHLTPEMQTRLTREVSKMPFAEGNSWVATRGGKTIRIVGALPFGDIRLNKVLRQMKPGIKAADLVYVEGYSPTTHPSFDQGYADDLRTYLYLPPGKSLEQMVPETHVPTLKKMARRINIPRGRDLQIQPWVYSIALRTTDCRGKGLTQNQGLAARTYKYQMSLGGVFIMGDVRKLLKNASSMSLRDQARYLNLSLDSAHETDDMLITYREAYFEEKIGEALLLHRWLRHRVPGVSRKEVERLLQILDTNLNLSFNRHWASELLDSSKNKLFVVVDAAHLPGREGLLNLLRKKGFKLQRTKFR